MPTAVTRLPDYDPPRSLGSIDFMLPVTSGLVGLFLFGGSLESCLRNRAPGAVANGVLAVSSGVTPAAPTINDFSAILSPGGAINTLLPDTADYSVVAVARSHPTLFKVIASTLNGSTSSTGYGEIANRASEGRLQQRTMTNSTAQTVNSGLANANDNFGIIAATCDSDAAGTVLKEYVPGRLAVPRSDTVTGARTLLSTASWWIGSDPDSATDGNPIEIAMVAIFNRAITSEEVDAISDYLRNGWYGPRLGGVMLP